MEKKSYKDYVLAYGYRRYTACKKLGWKTIPAYLQKENKIINISLSDIQIIDNTRIDDDSEGFGDLMQSIKQNGLLEPIGISKAEDLSQIDFIVTNLQENIQRRNITPYELAKALTTLKEYGLNDREIAIRLSLSEHRVKQTLELMRGVPADILKETVFLDSDRLNTSGKLSVTVANNIATLRLPNKESKELFKEAKEKMYSK